MAEYEESGAVMARMPAKINIVLEVGRVRTNGFHDLATVFQAVSLYDDVVASAADDFRLEIEGPYSSGVPHDESNLAVRAARLLAARNGVRRGVRLTIRKRIPVAAGLAGGSADAAGALLTCCRLWGVTLAERDLTAVAAELGSDVPFALRGGTALGEDRGECLRPLSRLEQLHWVLVPAAAGLSTPEVYRRFDELAAGHTDGHRDDAPQLPSDVLNVISQGGPSDVAAVMHNDLQAAALDARRSLTHTLRAGDDAGALAGIVSGSGPTCVFLARDAGHAKLLADRLTAANAGTTAIPVEGAATPTLHDAEPRA